MEKQVLGESSQASNDTGIVRPLSDFEILEKLQRSPEPCYGRNPKPIDYSLSPCSSSNDCHDDYGRSLWIRKEESHGEEGSDCRSEELLWTVS